MAKNKKGGETASPISAIDQDTIARARAANPSQLANITDDQVAAVIIKVRALKADVAKAHSKLVQKLKHERPGDPSLAPPERWQGGSEPEMVSVDPDDRFPVQRSNSGVQQLAKSGKIGAAEVIACNRWRSDYELGELGARDPSKSGVGGGADGYNISAIDALTRHTKATKAVGKFGTRLLIPFCAEGKSLNRMADLARLEFERSVAEYHRVCAWHQSEGRDPAKLSLQAPGEFTWDRKQIVGAVTASIHRLTEHYEEIDSAKGRLPSWEASRVKHERANAHESIADKGLSDHQQSQAFPTIKGRARQMANKFTQLERDLLIFHGVDPDEDAAFAVIQTSRMISEALENMHYERGQDFWICLAFNFVELQGRLDAVKEKLALILELHRPAESDTIHLKGLFHMQIGIKADHSRLADKISELASGFNDEGCSFVDRQLLINQLALTLSELDFNKYVDLGFVEITDAQ